MFTIDEKVTDNQIKRFATQAESIPTKALMELQDNFHGGKSIEFYEGLLAGYANMYQMADGKIPPQDLKNISAIIIAFLADYLKNVKKL